MVIGEGRDMHAVLLSLALFFAHESCGKCNPCRLGTRYQLEIVKKIVAGTATGRDIERLHTIGQTMTTASFCGLGMTAATAILSAIDGGLVKW
jgi:NADH-quinone oxidoreductase subunit F